MARRAGIPALRLTVWYCGGPTGRRVMRVVLSGSGTTEHGQVSDFATGFSHPLAILEAPDGGVLVGDYGTGQVTEIFRTS